MTAAPHPDAPRESANDAGPREEPSKAHWLRVPRWSDGMQWNLVWSGMGALAISLILASLFLLINGHNPLIAFQQIFIGAFGDRYAVAETLVKTTPLIFTALSVAVAFQAGLFNIGAEGQLLMGALAAAMVGSFELGLSPLAHIPLALLAAAAVGGLYGGLAGFIKHRFGAHEVIVTIMLNYIAILLTSYLVNYPWKAEGMVPQTNPVVADATLPRLIQGSQLTIGLFIALAVAGSAAVLLRATILGYEMKAVGFNPHASTTGGIRTARIGVWAMILAGGIAGMGGGVEILGVFGRFIQGFSPGYGYDGIAVSVLVNNNPALIPLSAMLFGVLRAGGIYLERSTSIPGDFTTVIQGLVIFFVAAPLMLSILFKRKGR